MIESVTIELGGKERKLYFDLGIMSEYEDLTGDNALMDDIFQGMTSKKLIRMVYVVLKVKEPDITIDEIGKMITGHNIKDVLPKVIKAFNLGIPDENPDKKKVTKK
jgi:hypothetical protein